MTCAAYVLNCITFCRSYQHFMRWPWKKKNHWASIYPDPSLSASHSWDSPWILSSFSSHSHQDSCPGVVLKDGKICAPNRRLVSAGCVGKNRPFCAQMQILHHGDACLCWYVRCFYMNQKLCYLMEGPANSRPTPTASSPGDSGQAPNSCPGTLPRKES